MCWADELLFVSVGNRFANKHLHVSINLTYKYELNLSLLAGYVGVELYSLLSSVLTNTTNFGGGDNPIDVPTPIIGGRVPAVPRNRCPWLLFCHLAVVFAAHQARPLSSCGVCLSVCHVRELYQNE